MSATQRHRLTAADAHRFTTLRSYAQKLRSEATLRSYTQKLRPEATLRSYAQKLRSEATLRSYAQKLRPEATLRSYAQKLHSEARLRSYTQKLHPEATPRSYTQKLHSEATPRSYSQKLHSETTLRSYTQKLHSEARLRSYTQKLHSEATFRNYTQKLHSEATPRSYTQKLHSEKYHTAPRLTDPPRPLVDDGRDAPESSASDRAALKQRLSGLQQKCLEEDTVLSGKKSQLSEVERALEKLQQKKQESLWEIAQLRERTGRLERERNTLESLLSKAEEDCVRWDLQALQRDSDQTPALKAPDVSINERQQRAVVEPEQNTLRRSEEEERASHWALQLLHEVRRLQELLPVHRGPKELPQSPTVEEALWALRSVRQQLQSFQSLQLSDNHMYQGEPRCQKKQLWTEKDQQRLLQVHTAGQSGVQTQGTSAGVLARLKERLRDKDSELQQLQANMTQWKELTAHKIACKYEEQLSAELQRCKAKVLQSRNMLKAPAEGGHGGSEVELAPEGKLLRHIFSEVPELQRPPQPSSSTAV
uniref:Uncharacterized protein n=1 Tax=Knipowitschia caucasica TaxID=637954 RepID=A0AAV2MSK8_KNICA